MSTNELDLVLARLDKIEAAVTALVEREMVKDWYTTAEVAKMLGKAEFTVREWCRQRRIRAQKRLSGRGKFQTWVIAHEEFLRFQKEGLLPTEF